jgi:septum formation protein
VVVHEGIIREKPTTKEEARQFLKGTPEVHTSSDFLMFYAINY